MGLSGLITAAVSLTTRSPILHPLILFPISILGIVIFAILKYSHIDKFFLINSAILTSLILALLWFRKKNNVKNLIVSSAIFQITSFLTLVFFLIPKLDNFWISKRINNIITKYENDVDQTFTFGFNEPSLLFLTSHKAKKHKETYKLKNKKILYLVEKDFEDSTLDNSKFRNFRLVDEIKGFNYSQGKTKLIRVYANF